MGNKLINLLENQKSYWNTVAKPQQQKIFNEVHRREDIKRKAQKRQRIPYKPIVPEQERMYYNNRYPKNTDFKDAVTGVKDKLTKQAIVNEQIATQDYMTGNPIVDRLNTLYPYGYKDKKSDNNAWGFIKKLFSKENNDVQKYADLDLSRVSKQEADSLYKLAKTDNEYGLENSPNSLKQFSIRARIDLNRLHGGYPQRYNTFTQDNGYTTKDGKRTWAFDDKDKINTENQYFKQILKSNPKNQSKNPSYKIYYLNQDPYAIYNNYSIIKDNNNSAPRSFDRWDFGLIPNTFPGMKEVLLGHEIK